MRQVTVRNVTRNGTVRQHKCDRASFHWLFLSGAARLRVYWRWCLGGSDRRRRCRRFLRRTRNRVSLSCRECRARPGRRLACRAFLHLYWPGVRGRRCCRGRGQDTADACQLFDAPMHGARYTLQDTQAFVDRFARDTVEPRELLVRQCRRQLREWRRCRAGGARRCRPRPPCLRMGCLRGEG